MNEEETYYWDTVAQAARGKALDQLHANAANWAKSLTALLGILALVGVTLAPSAWDDRELRLFGWDVTQVAPTLLILIFVGLLVSMWFALAGSQTSAREVQYDAQSYRDYYRDASGEAYRNLRWFRLALSVTAVPFVAYGLIGLLSQPKDHTVTLFQATTAAGLYCGQLSEQPVTGRLTLTTANKVTIPNPVTGQPVIKAVTPVKNCYMRAPEK